MGENVDITYAFECLVAALAAIVIWLKSITLTLGGITYTLFDITLTALSVAILIDAFIPWAGSDYPEDDEE